MDNELPVLLLWVLHGVKCLLGDAVQVHIPPVLQHLEGDVGAVYHSPRRLGERCINNITHTSIYPLSLISRDQAFIWILLKEKNIQSPTRTWQRWFNDVCRFRIWENLLDTGNKKIRVWLLLWITIYFIMLFFFFQIQFLECVFLRC